MNAFDAARELLGVDRDAGQDDIRRAWRRLARQHHPDAGGDAVRFTQLKAAVELLLDTPSPASPASPSTGRRAYPSTAGSRPTTTGVVIDDREVEIAILDGSLPVPGHAWDVGGLARAVAAHLRGESAVALVGVSRRPGSRLNRFSRHLSDDLLSTWRIQSASRRGVAGHDLEAVARFPSGGRRHVDRAATPPGWSTVRHSSSSESTFVIHPGRTLDATAVLAATAIDEFCSAIGWPLGDWRIPT